MQGQKMLYLNEMKTVKIISQRIKIIKRITMCHKLSTKIWLWKQTVWKHSADNAPQGKIN